MNNPSLNLLVQHQSQLLVIDVQEKLTAVMPSAPMQSMLKQSQVLLQAADLLAVPVLLTEQYPKGLGPTVQELRAHTSVKAVEKTAFSCCQVASFNRQLVGDKPQIVLLGMETHICVLQTALDLLARGKQVFIVEDAVISRNPEHKQNAIQRLRQAGCVVTNTESVIFEWLRVAEGDAFKTISKLIR